MTICCHVTKYNQMPHCRIAIRVTVFDLAINVSSSSFSIQRFLSHRKICITAKVIASRNFTIKYYKTDAIKTTFGVALWQTSRMQKCTCNLARRHSDVQLLSTHYFIILCFLLFTYFQRLLQKIKGLNQKSGNVTD